MIFSQQQFCYHGCGQLATYETKKGKHTCGKKPAQCPVIRKKMQATTKAIYGVENASQSTIVKKRKEATTLKNYGVCNPSHSPKVKNVISKKASARWDRITKDLFLQSKEQTLNLTKREYYKIVSKFTEWMYRAHIDIIDPERKRGDDWHLDHMVSRFTGYSSNIPPYIIGDINNLMIIPGLMNETKRQNNSITLDELLIRYNNYYKTNESIDTTIILAKPSTSHKMRYYDDEFGACSTCGVAGHYRSLNGNWCCEPSRNSCPVMKKKNSDQQKQSEKKKLATQQKLARYYQKL